MAPHTCVCYQMFSEARACVQILPCHGVHSVCGLCFLFLDFKFMYAAKIIQLSKNLHSS